MRRVIAAAFLAAACASGALPITGTFSDLRYVEESGDLVGTEIRIAAAGDGYQAVVQFAEGSPGELTIANVTFAPAGDEQSALNFDLPATSPYAGHLAVRLPRRRSYRDR